MSPRGARPGGLTVWRQCFPRGRHPGRLTPLIPKNTIRDGDTFAYSSIVGICYDNAAQPWVVR